LPRPTWPLALVLLGLLVSPAWAWKDRADGPESNVRVSLEAGYLAPVWFTGFDRGADAGLGLEIEQSPGLSYLFHGEWGRLWTKDQSPYAYPFYGYYASSFSRSIFTWAVGVRGYLRARETLRPYAELCTGIRLVDSVEPAEGLVFSPRVGVSIGRSGNAAMSLASGLDVSARQPRLYGVVPIRLAIVFH
jgi:hypothetical protein